MSFDDFDDDQHDEDNDSGQEQSSQQERNPLRAQLKRLERENRALKEKATAGETAARDLAFLKAGVDPDSPKAKYFVKAYDGDLTVEAIKAEAVAAGLVESQDDGAGDIPDDEQAAHKRTAENVAGATPAAARTIDDQIAEAQAAGNTALAIHLKREKAGLNTR